MYSIAIPAYNEVQHLGHLLGYLYEHRTDSVTEVLVCDNFSTDNTRSIVYEWQQRDPRIKLIESERPGKASAWNSLIRAASEPIVIFFDADVQPRAECLPRLLCAIGESDHLLYGCRRQAIYNADAKWGRLLQFISDPVIELCLAGGCYAVRKDELLARLQYMGFAEMPDVFAEDAWLQAFVKPDEFCILNDCIIGFEVRSLEVYLHIHARKKLVTYEFDEHFTELGNVWRQNFPEAINIWWQAGHVFRHHYPLKMKLRWFTSGVVKWLVNLYFARHIDNHFEDFRQAYRSYGGSHVLRHIASTSRERQDHALGVHNVRAYDKSH